MQNRLLELSADLVRVNLRTEMLVLIDKIMTTPFPLIKELKMV